MMETIKKQIRNMKSFFKNIINKNIFKKDCEKKSENVNITARESYMILDCFQCVLMYMQLEKLDYLYCNYSKEEIIKLAQRFGDMNLKNNW